MQQETNTSIEIFVELAIADAVFETGGDKHTSYRFRPTCCGKPPAHHVTSGEQALWLLLPVDSVLLVTHTHTGCCCDFVAVLNDRDLSGVVACVTEKPVWRHLPDFLNSKGNKTDALNALLARWDSVQLAH